MRAPVMKYSRYLGMAFFIASSRNSRRRCACAFWMRNHFRNNCYKLESNALLQAPYCSGGTLASYFNGSGSIPGWSNFYLLFARSLIFAPFLVLFRD